MRPVYNLLNWQWPKWNKSKGEAYDNPILAWWYETGFRADLAAALSENPPLLDVPVSDMEVLHAWVASDETLHGIFWKKRLRDFLASGTRFKKPSIRTRIITGLVGILVILTIVWLLAVTESDTPPFLSGIPFLIMIIGIIGREFLRICLRLRWKINISDFQVLMITIVLSFLASILQDSLTSSVPHGYRITWWFMLSIGWKMVFIGMIVAVWAVVILLIYELWVRLALYAVHKKRM